MNRSSCTIPASHWRRLLALTLAIAGLSVPAARGVDDWPDYHFQILTGQTKDGIPIASATPAGEIRNTWETYVEGWWKENSYHLANPSNGVSMHGFFPNTKTLGWNEMPWRGSTGIRGWQSALFFDPGKPGRTVAHYGEHNYELDMMGNPLQLYGGDGPLIDGYWTPGERFYDRNLNGRWDDVIYDEVYWNCSIPTIMTNSYHGNLVKPGYRDDLRGMNGTLGDAWDGLHGEIFADYTAVYFIGDPDYVPEYNSNAVIYVADPTVGVYSNIILTINELDLTPDVFTPDSNEGDFEHVFDNGGDPDPALDPALHLVPRNGVLDFFFGATASLIQRAYRYTDTNSLVTVSYDAWVYDPLYPDFIIFYEGTNAMPGGIPGDWRKRRITVPVYQVSELLGGFVGWAGHARMYMERRDDDPPRLPVLRGPPGNRPNHADIVNSRWDAGVPYEPYEDFISWWMPLAPDITGQPVGMWLGGIGVANEPNANPLNTIARGAYDDYIRNNYPGNVAALIARAGNNAYDGPDGWLERINTKIHLAGVQRSPAGALAATPAPRGGLNWDPFGWWGSWQTWWTNNFAGFGSASAPAWNSIIPNGNEMVFDNSIPAPSSPIITTNLIDGSVATTQVANAGVWVPRLSSTWGYDSPQEYVDMPKSLHHSAGDERFGEITSPFTDSINGEDRGKNSMAAASIGPPDGIIPSAGPYAWVLYGLHGTDAGNLMNFEWLTWRTDGQNFTGPRDVHSASGIAPVGSGGDHRDVNLDGLVDSGETIDHTMQAYALDDVATHTPVGGAPNLGHRYPFNVVRFYQDMVAASDYWEDYASVRHNNTIISEPVVRFAGWLIDGVPGTPLANVVYARRGTPHTGYAMDDHVWIDADGSGDYNTDVILNAATGTIARGTPGVALANCVWRNTDGIGSFDRLYDDAWVDANGNGGYDSEFVICDSDARDLRVGDVGVSVSLVNPNARVRYLDNDASTTPTPGDAFWMEYRYNTNGTDSVFDTNDVVITTGGNLLSIGALASGTVLNAIYKTRNPVGVPDTGYLVGDAIWIDSTANFRFDGEEILTRVNPFAHATTLNRTLTNGTPGVAFGDPVIYFERGGAAGFQQAYDDAWLDAHTTGAGAGTYSSEDKLSRWAIADGTVADGALPNAVYYDLPLNFFDDIEPKPAGSLTPGVFDLGREVFPDEQEYGNEDPGEAGDPVWLDGNLNGIYDRRASANVPVYAIGYHEGAGMSTPVAYNGYSVQTIDERPALSGLIQSHNVYSLGIYSHEQGHDIAGWVDYYDFDRWQPPQYSEHPIGAWDIMGEGGLVHSIPYSKGTGVGSGRPWSTQVSLQSVLMKGATKQTLRLWPIERNFANYFTFQNEDLSPLGSRHPEHFKFWYQAGGSTYSVLGARGVSIKHDDFSGFSDPAAVPQQRANPHYTWAIVQADGLYEMEDGVNGGEVKDWFGQTNRVFTPATIPWSRWWNQRDSGISITDIRMPDDAWGPAEVDFVYYSPDAVWDWRLMSGYDSDGDGIPDAWEYYWHPQSLNPLGEMSRNTDWDMDGLTDYEEWLTGTDPCWRFSSSGSGQYTPGDPEDAAWDMDGDGLSNADELRMFGTDPREADTDDDGYSDGQEVNASVFCGPRRFTHPVYSRSPLIQRSMVLTGSAVEIPPVDNAEASRLALPEWTIECWVYLTNANQTGYAILRETATGQTNYAIEVVDNVPVATFSTEGGVLYRAVAPATFTIGVNDWTHLAATFSPDSKALRLYVDAVLVSEVIVDSLEGPAMGAIGVWNGGSPSGRVYLGGGIRGYMDEVRIWAVARLADQIEDGRDLIVNTPWASGTVSAAATSTVPGKRYALMVGIDNYSPAYGPTPLTSCVNDALGMQVSLLADPARWSLADMTVLTDGTATKAAIRGAIAAMANTAVSGDTVLYYHSSHGGQNTETETYLCAYDANYEDYELAADLGSFRDGVTVIVIADACFSGGLFKSPFTGAPTWNLINNVTDEIERLALLKELVKAPEIGWIAACDADETCWAGTPYSLFTGYLIQGFRSGDANADQEVSFLELYDYAAPRAQTVNPGQAAQTSNTGVLGAATAVSMGAGGGPVPVLLTNSVQSVGLVANFRFDDAQNETHVNRDDGTIHRYGAEDSVHPMGLPWLNWQYAITNATFSSTNYYANVHGGFTTAEPIDDLDEDGIPDWWQELFWADDTPPYVPGGGPGAWSPLEDPDTDGNDNLTEYMNDTNPRDIGSYVPIQPASELYITDIRWYDNDLDGLYSQNDTVSILFSVAVSNPTAVAVSQMVLGGVAGATWGTGATIASSPDGTMLSIIVGSSPVLVSGLTTVDPADTVVSAAGGTPDVTSPPFPLPGAEVDDEDGDGLLDSWETDFGLSTSSGIGDDGPYGDPDHDGLINLYEYLAYLKYGVRLDPKRFDTYAGDGPTEGGDYYGEPPAFPAIGKSYGMYGEMFDDTDQLPDWWEVQYPGKLGRLYYDATFDPDWDLWNNYAEYMYEGIVTGTSGIPTNVRSTDPSSPASYPEPTISGVIRYEGVLAGDYHVAAYNTPTMDSLPVAMGTVTPVGRVITFDMAGLTAGNLYLFAWKGADPFATNNPAGTPYRMPLDLKWGNVSDVVINLTDPSAEPWYPRFAWTGRYDPVRATQFFIRISSGSGTKPLLGTKWIKATRDVFRREDYRSTTWLGGRDYRNGLPAGSYEWNAAYSEAGGLGDIFASGSFSVLPYTPPVPTLVSPAGGSIVGNARSDFSWSTTSLAPQFQIRVSRADGSWAYTNAIPAPWRQENGVMVYEWPDLLGSGVWQNGDYTWSVRAQNWDSAGTLVSSAWATEGSFTIDVAQPPPEGDGAPALVGEVLYFGKLPITNLIVNAYKTPSFSDLPQGQAIVNVGRSFVIRGLYNNSYFVKAFLDVNGNGVEDYWEPMGIARDADYGQPYYEFWTDYKVGTFDLRDRYSIRGIRLVVFDRDTDNDNMPDGWEYLNLTDAGGNPTLTRSGSGDQDGDGLTNLEEYYWGTNPRVVDTDGDGVSDGDEVHVFHTNPVGNFDSDGDGLTDEQEMTIYGTNPSVADSDGDGILDGAEVAMGLNPLASNNDAYGVPANVKVGWDGNAAAYNAYPGGGDLRLDTVDSDGDGVSDLEEIAAGSNPLSAGSSSRVSIAGWRIDGLGRMVVEWDVFSNARSVDVRFYVESSPSLTSPVWTLVGTYTANGDVGGRVALTDTLTAGPYYRLRFVIPAQ